MAPACARSRRLAWGYAAAFLVLAGLGGCSQATPYPAGLKSEDVSTRIRAIKMAGDRRDRSAVPVLVDRLEDEDDAVRVFAIIALERITGTRLGYDYAKPAPERARAVMRWRSYVHGRGAAATQPVPATGPAWEATSP